ncbi:hypothetical protein [Canibacter zhoujuaniae]|uniref:hypothetical protein n=1 Tax=Canibacter zhoujuaniae TaxID=2708343 RepID=UPI001421814C|nr:hypothetical protein [Canibacter zhoujuaniae]
MIKSTSDDVAATRIFWLGLRAILLLEVLLAFGLVYRVARGALAAHNEPYHDLILLLIMAILCLGWALTALAGAWRAKPWSRALSLTLQVGVFAVAVSLFQGLFGQQLVLAWALVVISIGGFICALKARPNLETEPSQE